MYPIRNNIINSLIAGNEPVLVCRTLKEFSEMLAPHRFLRAHQSHLVNLDFVKSYLKENGGMLLLSDKAKVPISRQNRDKVKDELNKSL